MNAEEKWARFTQTGDPRDYLSYAEDKACGQPEQ